MLKLTVSRRVCPRLLLAGQKVSRKYRAVLIRRHAYKKLKSIVPSIAKRDRVSKLKVIKETIKYIDELHQELVKRAPSLLGDRCKSIPTSPEEFFQMLLCPSVSMTTTTTPSGADQSMRSLPMTSSFCACALTRQAACTTCKLQQPIARRNS